MKIPSRVKIGGHWFNIEYRDEDDDFYEKTGSKHSWLNKIILQDRLVQSKKESTLFHEIIHELSSQAEIGLEERQVGAVAEGIYQVLVDNKWLNQK